MEETIINIITPPPTPITIDVITPAPAPVTISVTEDIDEVAVIIQPPIDEVDVNVVPPAATPVVINVSSIGEKGDPGSAEGSLNYIIDAGTSVITTGLKGFVEWGFAATVTGWTILADVLGSIVVDVWKDNYGNFQPTIADTIAGTEKPTLVSSQKNQDLSLTSFSVTVLKGDIWALNVDSISEIKKVTIAFRFDKN